VLRAVVKSEAPIAKPSHVHQPAHRRYPSSPRLSAALTPQKVPLVFVAYALGAPVVDLEKRQSCSSLKLVHVSGTTEIGLGIVGTPLAAALASAVPGWVNLFTPISLPITNESKSVRTTTQSITYDTSAEYVVTVAAGAAITVGYLATQSALCPNQRFVLSGYSKGALVLHSMYPLLDLRIWNPILSAIMQVPRLVVHSRPRLPPSSYLATQLATSTVHGRSTRPRLTLRPATEAVRPRISRGMFAG
jgi:hypothetical protein